MKAWKLPFDPFFCDTQSKTPYFLLSAARLRQNLAILKQVNRKSGAKILLALKAFASPTVFELMHETLNGICASGLHEARFGAEEFVTKNPNTCLHAYCPAIKPEDFNKILDYSDHLIFNSINELEKYAPSALQIKPDIKLGLRVNPGVSASPTAKYDPCAPLSRFGVPIADLPPALPTLLTRKSAGKKWLTGLHIHALCEQDAPELSSVLRRTEAVLGEFLPKFSWLNLGGGHHITRFGYDTELLCSELCSIREKYKLQVFLEPGEAVAYHGAWLVATVLDIVENAGKIAILDTSAAAHMPDVIEMPYAPMARLFTKCDEKGEKTGSAFMKAACLKPRLANSQSLTRDWIRLAGNSCLAGDVIGDYKFGKQIKRGDRVVFSDMGHYTMVKTNTFNGIALPDIYLQESDYALPKLIKSFGYEDFRARLA